MRLEYGYYKTHDMLLFAEQAIVMLSCCFDESGDDSSGGFFADNTQATRQVRVMVNSLRGLNGEWALC